MTQSMTREDIEKEIGVPLAEIAALGQFGLRVHELEVLYRTATEISPKVLVEIGACHGLSSIVLGMVARKHDGHVYSVEYKPQPDWLPNIQKYGLEALVTMVEGITPWLHWDKVPFRRVSYLLIDGNHHYFPVACDFQTYAPFVHRGGRIAFHDFHKPASKCGVREVVERAESMYPLKRVATTFRGPGLAVIEKLSNRPVWR